MGNESDYILLKDKKRCPKCDHATVPRSLPSRCRHCGMLLFKDTDAIKRWEEDTGWREYWVWTNLNGWMHRTQVFDQSPIRRETKLQKLDDNYGTEEFINQKIANSRMELKDALKKKKLKPTKTIKYEND